MPVENLEAESLEKNPNLELAQLKFLLTNPEHQNDKNFKRRLMEAIIENKMAPLYEEVCKDLSWPIDDILLQKNEKCK